MDIGILEDFTSEVELDAQLLETPKSGLYVNSGTHPSVTLENLLEFLPNTFEGLKAYDSDKTYGKYEDTRKRSDLVTYNNKIYQSIAASNQGNDPEAQGSVNWLETNVESLVLKNMLFNTAQRVKSELNLTKRLVNSQFLYENGSNEQTLPNDYAAWVFEPKGSDYISFCVNQIAFQKNSSTPVSLYVVNQGVLVDTLTLTPTDGKLEFTDLGYSFSGKGKWYFVIDSTDVLVGNGVIDHLAYDGFVAYTATGTGAAPETALYSDGATGNGMGFNISVYLDPETYLDNNLQNMGAFLRATFEYLAFQTFLHNPNNVSSRVQRIQMEDEILIAETKSMEADTVARRFHSEKKRAVKMLEKTFDTQLNDNSEMEIEYGTI